MSYVKRTFGVKGSTLWFEKDQNAKRGSLLWCCCKHGPFPILIHSDKTNAFVVLSQLRSVLWHMINVYGVNAEKLCLI